MGEDRGENRDEEEIIHVYFTALRAEMANFVFKLVELDRKTDVIFQSIRDSVDEMEKIVNKHLRDEANE